MVERYVRDPCSAEVAAAWFAVTPSNTVDFAYVARGFYVGVTGNVVAVNEDDTTVTFVAVPAGQSIGGRFRRINATNTTATSILGAY